MEALGVGLGLRVQTRARPRPRRAVVRVTASGNAGGGSKRKGKKQGGAFSTVEAAVSFLAQLLSAGDMFGTTGSSFKDDARFDRTDDGADKKVELRGWKWIKISGKARTSTRVATVGEAPLDVYLQLPPEEYSLLDPQFVKRESPSTFRFTVPMREVIKKDKSYGGPGEILKELTPTILFTTEVDTARQRVQLKGDGAALGQADLDTRFDLELKNVLTWEAMYESAPEADDDAGRIGVVVMDDDEDEEEDEDESGRSSSGLKGKEIIVAEYTDLDAKDRGAADMRRRAPCPPGWELRCDTRLSMRVQVPRPLSVAPSFLLGGAFSIIASAVMAAILPKFAEFVAADYARWARGEDRSAPVGSFGEEKKSEEDDAGDGVVQF